jgi:hypothetical protein
LARVLVVLVLQHDFTQTTVVGSTPGSPHTAASVPARRKP